MNADSKRLDEISERVIGCAFTVANTLGAGFLEKVYENALAHELTKAGLMVRQQIAIGVEYDGVTVGASRRGPFGGRCRVGGNQGGRSTGYEPRRSMPEFLFGRPGLPCAC
jgi:hypothetical protein